MFWFTKKKRDLHIQNPKLISDVKQYVDENISKYKAKTCVYSCSTENVPLKNKTINCFDTGEETGFDPPIPSISVENCSTEIELNNVSRKSMASNRPFNEVIPKKVQLSLQSVPSKPERSLEDVLQNMGETFQQRLFRMIDEKGLTDAQAYKRAGKDRKLFHKIRNNTNYQPSKHTVFAFALGLKLSLDETIDLLASAGFAMAPGNRFDLIIQYAVEHKIYDLHTVDCILNELGETDFFNCI